jgi:hypothetical protein
MSGYTYRAVFVGKRVEGHPRDPNTPYALFLKPEGQNDRYLYFLAQASPIAEAKSPERPCFCLTFRKSDGRQVLENRRGQVVEGGWQLERKKGEERAA